MNALTTALQKATGGRYVATARALGPYLDALVELTFNRIRYGVLSKEQATVDKTSLGVISWRAMRDNDDQVFGVEVGFVANKPAFKGGAFVLTTTRMQVTVDLYDGLHLLMYFKSTDSGCAVLDTLDLMAEGEETVNLYCMGE